MSSNSHLIWTKLARPMHIYLHTLMHNSRRKLSPKEHIWKSPSLCWPWRQLTSPGQPWTRTPGSSELYNQYYIVQYSTVHFTLHRMGGIVSISLLEMTLAIISLSFLHNHMIVKMVLIFYSIDFRWRIFGIAWYIKCLLKLYLLKRQESLPGWTPACGNLSV